MSFEQNDLVMFRYTLEIITTLLPHNSEISATNKMIFGALQPVDITWIIPLSLLVLYIIFWTVTAKNYSLKKALSELKQVDGKTEHVESSSRLIAFLSGIVALTISLTITMVSMHKYLSTGTLPDFQNLVNALLALGIGVVPYSINKVAGIFR